MRLENLRSYLANPNRITDWVDRDVATAIDKQMPRVKLEALEHMVHTTILQHWQPILGKAQIALHDPDWDNALLLYHTTTKNRRFLKQLLHDEASGDQQRIPQQHPSNQAFIQNMQRMGINMEVWMGPFEKRFVIHGDIWTVYAETCPLRVLQMGNLFGTCLSLGAVKAFSTIANAVEVNKRVLYIRNGTGAIIGRKLIVLSSSGDLLGFYSYGSADSYSRGGSSWIKILFDLFCLEFAQHTGARLDHKQDNDTLALFAAWYDDGELFDWWVTEQTLCSPSITS